MRMLVVEDEAKAAAYLRKGLTESGFQVEVANDGLDARHFIEQDHFDLVILDIMLPHLNGWQLLEILRAKAQTPVLFLTARDSVEDRVRGLESGGDDYLVKPFSYAELLLTHQGEVLSRSDIASKIWDMNFDSDTKVVDVAIRRLRLKIDEGHAQPLIQTVRGMGYVLNADGAC